MEELFEKLKQNVESLNKIVGSAILVSLGALLVYFFILYDRIDDRFDNLDKQFDILDDRIATLSEQISDLRVETTKRNAKLEQILESVDALSKRKLTNDTKH